jgi:N-methylhydantoinase B/oxoprolinase/acetone carboxylase alpha subunit
MSLLSDRRKQKPYGLSGGEDGKAGNAAIISIEANASNSKQSPNRGNQAASVRKRAIGSKGSWELSAHDRIRIETPGGGGFGKNSKVSSRSVRNRNR